jgi:hypothetical protein
LAASRSTPSGYQTLDEIAETENIHPSDVSRVLRMTLLAPEIVEAILAGRRFPVERIHQMFP